MLEIRPGDARYGSVQHVYGAVGRPALVLLPDTTSQVAEAIVRARDLPGPLAIRSGGHGISSLSTNDGGTVIDLRRLSRIERLDSTHVRLGPGARWGSVADALQPWGLAISSGDSGDVGVGGLATTGGLGLMGRAHGLTIDRLRRAEVVLADGSVHVVSAEENVDLFWAVRGAGANMGIVTSFEFEASPTSEVARATIVYAPEDLASFFVSWGAAVEASPRAISAFLYVGGGPTPFAQATVVYAGSDVNGAQKALTPFAALPGIRGQRAELVPYADVPITMGAPHSGQQTAVTHTGLADHLDLHLSAALASLVDRGALDMLQIRSAGGAINDVDELATAYAHRHQNFSVTGVSASASAAFDDGWAPLRDDMPGIYLSFESNHRPEDIARAFPPATLDKLRRIKSTVDPESVFNQNFDLSATAPNT
ncbi:FAD-binding oxidoreductase [Leifsonia sp. RAF41]|uniref:FAD-binding oxidoreductase n=1 Tax=Leifsonia sp. RAF41 TaxID=3233056 RepID=UPI003F99F1F5